jgi:F-type H+-transporting ATPase subunit a
MVSEALRGMFLSALGPGGERHLPLIYGLFWYIIFCDLIELIPIFHAVTANPSNTIGLGIIVFIYSQYVGIKSKGLGSYLKHFVGPVIFLAPLLLPIEIIGEVIKPFTLGFRLFGNIYAEDIMHELASPGWHDMLHNGLLWLMIPVQVLICGLQVFTGVIQAYIFALLSCAYIGLMAEHHDDHGDSYNGHPHSEDVTEKLAESLGAHTAARAPAA